MVEMHLSHLAHGPTPTGFNLQVTGTRLALCGVADGSAVFEQVALRGKSGEVHSVGFSGTTAYRALISQASVSCLLACPPLLSAKVVESRFLITTVAHDIIASWLIFLRPSRRAPYKSHASYKHWSGLYEMHHLNHVFKIALNCYVATRAITLETTTRTHVLQRTKGSNKCHACDHTTEQVGVEITTFSFTSL